MDMELRPCPFCGGEASVFKHRFTVAGRTEWDAFSVAHECSSVGLIATERFSTEDAAAEAWNRRTYLSALADCVHKVVGE